MDVKKTLESLPKYTQVLYNDCTMYLLEDTNIASPMRKELIISMIKLVREQIDHVEESLIKENIQ